MAEQPNTPPPPVDPVTAFWRDVMARSAAGMGNMGQMPNMPGMPNFPGMPNMPEMGANPMMTPEAMRKMQSAFFEAMAQYAEQHMRTPQFLESMKKSMDQAMQLRQQMDGFLKSNMATAFETATGGANTEILNAIRQSTAQLQAQIAKIDERVSDLEAAVTGKPAKTKAEPQSKTQKKTGKR